MCIRDRLNYREIDISLGFIFIMFVIVGPFFEELIFRLPLKYKRNYLVNRIPNDCVFRFYSSTPVSYTHLDVYKRQVLLIGADNISEIAGWKNPKDIFAEADVAAFTFTSLSNLLRL